MLAVFQWKCPDRKGNSLLCPSPPTPPGPGRLQRGSLELLSHQLCPQKWQLYAARTLRGSALHLYGVLLQSIQPIAHNMYSAAVRWGRLVRPVITAFLYSHSSCAQWWVGVTANKSWCEPEQSTFILALQQMLAAFSFLMSTLCAQLQGKLSNSLKLIDPSGFLYWNVMSWMRNKKYCKYICCLGEGSRKDQMHSKSVSQKLMNSLQLFPLMCASDWFKNSGMMSSAVVLISKS